MLTWEVTHIDIHLTTHHDFKKKTEHLDNLEKWVLDGKSRLKTFVNGGHFGFPPG